MQTLNLTFPPRTISHSFYALFQHMKHLLSLLLVTTALSFFTAEASAETFTFVRPGDPSRAFQQTEPLRIALPPGLSREELNQLFLELNGIDITQMVTIENGTIIFYPASPYNAGGQMLRLVRLGKNGKLVEISHWNFTVASAPPVSSPTSLTGSVDAAYSILGLENGHLGNTPDRHNITSQFHVEGATQQGDWQFKGRSNGFVNTDAAYNPAGNAVEVGEYLLSAERPGENIDTLLRLGHHDIGANNLLMNQFYRRGASAQFNINDVAHVTGFAQDPSAIFGNNNISGMEDTHQRVEGAYLTYRPLGDKSDATLEATAYTGKGSMLRTTTGTSVAVVDTPEQSGNGFQLGFNTTVIPEYASVRVQGAHTNFDTDGAETLASSTGDKAGRVALTVTPLGKQLSDDGRLRLWSVELAYQKVGSFFQSLLSPLLEPDREMYSLSSNYLHGATTLDGQVAWITDNVNDLSALPHNRSLNAWAQASHAIEKPLPGKPVVFLGGSAADEDRLKTPFGYAGPGLDRFTGSVNGGVALNYDTTSVNLTHTFSVLRDAVDGNNDYDTHYTDLTLEVRPNERLTLRPGFQMEHLDQAAAGESQSYHVSLGSDFIILPDKFWNNTNVSFLLNEGASSARNNTMMQTEFTWLLKQAAVNNPGYAIGLAGQYGQMTDPETHLIENEKEGRIFLRLKLSAPFAF